MAKKIVVLNGSPRKHGNTAALIDQFIAGAQSVGHRVTRFDIAEMNIRPCIGCLRCRVSTRCSPSEQSQNRRLSAKSTVRALEIIALGPNRQVSCPFP